MSIAQTTLQIAGRVVGSDVDSSKGWIDAHACSF